MEEPRTKGLLRAALLKRLRPTVNLLIKKEISHSEFSEVAKGSYALVTHSDFAIPQRKKTYSGAAVLTRFEQKGGGTTAYSVKPGTALRAAQSSAVRPMAVGPSQAPPVISRQATPGRILTVKTYSLRRELTKHHGS
jgi:hypothetical protein